MARRRRPFPVAGDADDRKPKGRAPKTFRDRIVPLLTAIVLAPACVAPEKTTDYCGVQSPEWPIPSFVWRDEVKIWVSPALNISPRRLSALMEVLQELPIPILAVGDGAEADIAVSANAVWPRPQLPENANCGYCVHNDADRNPIFDPVARSDYALMRDGEPLRKNSREYHFAVPELTDSEVYGDGSWPARNVSGDYYFVGGQIKGVECIISIDLDPAEIELLFSECMLRAFGLTGVTSAQSNPLLGYRFDRSLPYVIREHTPVPKYSGPRGPQAMRLFRSTVARCLVPHYQGQM